MLKGRRLKREPLRQLPFLHGRFAGLASGVLLFGSRIPYSALEGYVKIVPPAVKAALASQAVEVVVVLGHMGNQVKAAIAAAVPQAKVRFVTNPDFADGLSTSVRAGIAALGKNIDAAIVQVDEANLPGHPEDADWAHEPINHVLKGVCGQKGLHLCFGNYGGQSIQKGYWRNLLPFLNRLEVDHLVLEFARRGYDELDAFRDLRPGIALGLGVVDIKDNEVESPDLIASRIAHAVKVLGAERIKWVHPDCGFWMLSRSVADRKMAALVAGRNQFLGHGA